MLAYKSKQNEGVKFVEYELKQAYLHTRSDSESTLVEGFGLLKFPTEILVVISMHCGFVGAMMLMQTCTRFKEILKSRNSWKYYQQISADVLETLVRMDTRLHKFDQISFCEWTRNNSTMPCLMHLSFTDQYDFLGGISFAHSHRIIQPEFFESRDRIGCPTDESHKCTKCLHYDTQRIQRSSFVNNSDAKIEHLYSVNRGLRLKIIVENLETMLGYSDWEPSLTIQLHKLNGIEMPGRMRALYKYYTQ